MVALDLTNIAQFPQAAAILLGIYNYSIVIANLILLPIIVATFLFSKSVKRHATFVNVCIAWIVSGVASNLIFFSGEHVGPEPRLGICITQTSLLYGVSPMWAVALLMMVLHVATASNSKEYCGSLKMFGMLAAPYISALAFSMSAAILSLQHPEDVNRARRFFYCSLRFDPLSNSMAIFTALVLLGATSVEIYLGVTLWKNWKGIRKAGHSAGVDVQLIMRVLAFGIYVLIGMVVSMMGVFHATAKSLVIDMFAGTTGVAFVLTFGTQPDLWAAWKSGILSLLKPKSSKPGPMIATLSLDTEKGSSDWSNKGASFDSYRPVPPPKDAHFTPGYSARRDDAYSYDGGAYRIEIDPTNRV